MPSKPDSQPVGGQGGQPGDSSGRGGSQSGQSGSTGGRAGNNPASNLSREDRVRGGEHSAQIQERDEFGQFAGSKRRGESSSTGDSMGPRGSSSSSGGGSNGASPGGSPQSIQGE